VDRPVLLVGTPGRVKEMIEKEWLSFDTLDTLIIDEADKFCQISKQSNNTWQGVKFFEDL
jgi:superfamily II DNA/RNA helicase